MPYKVLGVYMNTMKEGCFREGIMQRKTAKCSYCLRSREKNSIQKLWNAVT